MKKWIEKYRQVGLYLFFGVTTTAVNWLIYTPLQGILGMTAANALAWLGAVLYAFVTNKLFVFESRGGAWVQEGLKFFGARIFSGLLEIFLPTALFALGEIPFLFTIVPPKDRFYQKNGSKKSNQGKMLPL